MHLIGCVNKSPITGISQEIWDTFLLDNKHRITHSNELIFTSHTHRSLSKNIRECIRKIQKLLHEASYVPPVKEPIVHDHKRRDKIKFNAWLYGSKNQRRIMKGMGCL
uniref:Uncharacterized protein n=1 Tax=Paramoeba aestuarina TaxID=180227 RepID=A0A7S4UBB3_9EUKA